MNKQYEGKFVFVESTDEKNTYHNGEYICVRQTPASIYCVKPTVGYGGHEIKPFALSGSSPYKVIQAWEDAKTVQRVADDLAAWADQIKDPFFKKQWVESVYHGAAESARAIMRSLGRTIGVELERPDLETYCVVVPKNTKKILLQFKV